MTATLYDRTVEITREYLGLAAQRFVDRQIKNHLDKEPRELTKEDLDELTDWIKMSFAMIAEDRVLVDEYIDKLKSLV